jgi:hypothetical protein
MISSASTGQCWVFPGVIAGCGIGELQISSDNGKRKAYAIIAHSATFGALAGVVEPITKEANREMATGKGGLSRISKRRSPGTSVCLGWGVPTPGDRRQGASSTDRILGLVPGRERRTETNSRRCEPGWRRACGRSLSSKCLCRGAPAVRRRLVVRSAATENTHNCAGVNMRIRGGMYSFVQSLPTYLLAGQDGGFRAAGIAAVKK